MMVQSTRKARYPSAFDTYLSPPTERDTERPAVRSIHRWLARRIALSVGNPPVAIRLWNGEDAYIPDTPPVGRLVFHHPKGLYAVICKKELGAGDAYTAGHIDVEGDFIGVMQSVFSAIEAQGAEGVRAFKSPLLPRLPKIVTNTPAKATRNAQYHYDLSNDFYRLWLDENMVYTCAYYPQPDMSLERAQLAKMDHVCRKVQLRPGMRVVEAGCGWGALALHMARNYGVSVRAYNVSHEQVRYARERARAEGLTDCVEFVEDDFRAITGEYDAFVSVGMLEHVGPSDYDGLGAVIERCLKKQGLGLLHSVGRNRSTLPNAWIAKRIFPGSFVPSLGKIIGIFEPYPLSVLDVENLRLHYARTLKDWLARFERRAGEIAQTYGEAFVRAWRLYLGGCSASFAAGNMQLFQVVFAHTGNNDVPMSRRHLHKDETADRGAGRPPIP